MHLRLFFGISENNRRQTKVQKSITQEIKTKLAHVDDHNPWLIFMVLVHAAKDFLNSPFMWSWTTNVLSFPFMVCIEEDRNKCPYLYMKKSMMFLWCFLQRTWERTPFLLCHLPLTRCHPWLLESIKHFYHMHINAPYFVSKF